MAIVYYRFWIFPPFQRTLNAYWKASLRNGSFFAYEKSLENPWAANFVESTFLGDFFCFSWMAQVGSLIIELHSNISFILWPVLTKIMKVHLQAQEDDAVIWAFICTTWQNEMTLFSNGGHYFSHKTTRTFQLVFKVLLWLYIIVHRACI